MSNKSNRPGTEFSDDEIALITSLGLLGVTPAGEHIAKTSSGTLANTPDSGGGGGGGSYTFSNGLNEVGGDVTLGSSLTQATTISQATNDFEISESSNQGLFLSASDTNALKGEGVEVVGGNVATFGSPVEVRLFTPTINSATAVTGQVVVLKNSTSGEIDFQDIDTWWDVVIGASAKGTPVSVTGGSVTEHTYKGSSLYRFIPTPYDSTLDNFYLTFDGTNVSDLYIKRVP